MALAIQPAFRSGPGSSRGLQRVLLDAYHISERNLLSGIGAGEGGVGHGVVGWVGADSQHIVINKHALEFAWQTVFILLSTSQSGCFSPNLRSLFSAVVKCNSIRRTPLERVN